MSDVLVVYYSRSGTTDRVARQLAGKLKADLDVIRPEADYAGTDGYRRGVWHSIIGLMPRVGHGRDPAGYSLVVIGSPVWAGNPSAPVRSYLKANRDRIQTLAAFCVSGSGQRYAGFFRAVERLAGRSLTATMALAERDVTAGASEPALTSFVADLHPGRA
ncbi:MAG: hypothetical protein B7Y99_04145 [Caulobacterales bacterium 32-69-10]|nr:MAG: hypothetical protein B7Y99_04145 [Caulobacterales bacterium 32-69-10]